MASKEIKITEVVRKGEEVMVKDVVLVNVHTFMVRIIW